MRYLFVFWIAIGLAACLAATEELASGSYVASDTKGDRRFEEPCSKQLQSLSEPPIERDGVRLFACIDETRADGRRPVLWRVARDGKLISEGVRQAPHVYSGADERCTVTNVDSSASIIVWGDVVDQEGAFVGVSGQIVQPGSSGSFDNCKQLRLYESVF